MSSTIIRELRLSGIFDLNCSSSIDRAAAAAIKDGIATLLINMRDVIFMDSRGLRVLVCLLRMLKPHGIGVAVCSLSPQVKVLFEITSMHRLFEIYDRSEVLALDEEEDVTSIQLSAA
jgi:anti-sigma B factor antagonist